MKTFIHLSVLLLYLFSSSLLVGSKQLVDENENESIAAQLINMLTFSLSEFTENSNAEIPLLFKDPTDEPASLTGSTLSLLTFSYHSVNYSGSIEQKLKDPFYIILSPPPQSI